MNSLVGKILLMIFPYVNKKLLVMEFQLGIIYKKNLFEKYKLHS